MLNHLKNRIPVIRNSLHSTMLFSFIALTLLIVLSTTLIFSSMYIDTIYNELTFAASNDLDRINMEFDNLFLQIRNLFRLLKENPDINSFICFSNFDPLIINRTDTYLKQIQYTNPFFHSITLYNPAYGSPIHAGKTGVDVMQFTRKSLKSPDVKSDFNFVTSTITSNSTTGVNQIQSALSIVFTEAALDDSTDGNLTIINLDREEVEKKLLGKLDGITLVTDDSGHVIFNPYGYVNTSSLFNESYYMKILNDKEYRGSFRTKISSDNKLITYVKNIESGFYIINIRSVNSIAKPITKARTTFIVISLLIAVIFSFSGYFISNRIFSPIKQVAEKFLNSKFGQQIPRMTEIDMISKVFEETTEYMRQLENKNEHSSSKQKENIFRLLLKGNITPELAKQELSDCKLKVVFSNLIHVCVRIDNFADMNENDKPIYETTLWRIIPEIVKGEFDCEAVNMFQGELALFVNYKKEKENSFPLLLSAIDKVRRISTQTLHITLTAGIGGAANSIEECYGAYQKAVEMAKQRFVLGQNMTIYKQLLEDRLSTHLSYPSEMEDKLVAAIKANKKTSYLTTLHDFIELLGNYPYSEVVSILFQFMTSCIKAINQITNQNSNRPALNFDEFSTRFFELQTLEHVKEWMISIFDEYQGNVEQINQLKNNKHYIAVEKMQEYIREHYHDIGLSVELVAEKAGYTPSYFTRIFKEISGLYVNDYIRQMRIDKAKALLSLPDNKVSDIPAAVGFTNLSHFSTVFKKDVGLTPSAYREYVLAKK